MEMDGVGGVYFAVWAPNAKSVSVIGTFNYWDHRLHAMRTLGTSGVWEIFIPGIGEGEHYKYQITTIDNVLCDKADPHGFGAELSPQTASVVYDLDKYQWQDQQWMDNRKQQHQTNAPMIIYELHLGSWMRDPANPSQFFDYRQIAPKIAEYINWMGYTHVELLPIMEHPFYARGVTSRWDCTLLPVVTALLRG